MQKIRVSDQYAADSVTTRKPHSGFAETVIETALQHVNLKKLSARTKAGHGVLFCELPMTGLLVLRTKSEHDALQNALKATLDVSLPKTLQSETKSNCTIRWVAPDEWMLSCPIEDAFNIENQLRSSFSGQSLAIVNVSGGFTVLRVSGEHAYDLLKKSTAYDVHPSNFTQGKVVNTVLAKAQIMLRCIDFNEYEIVVRRSFADYLWYWIQVSSAEYGLGIEVQ